MARGNPITTLMGRDDAPTTMTRHQHPPPLNVRRSPATAAFVLLSSVLAAGCVDGSSSPASMGNEGSSGSGDGGNEAPTTSGTAQTTEGAGSTGSSSTTTLDSSSSGSDDGSSGESSSSCGNGVLDEDEQCDDGNTSDGDHCYSTCTLPIVPIWTQYELHGNPNTAHDLTFTPDDRVYAVGVLQSTGHRDTWLRAYSAQGDEEGFTTYGGGFGLEYGAVRLALHGSGEVLFAGAESAADGTPGVFYYRDDPFVPGSTWAHTYDSPNHGLKANLDRRGAVVAATNGDVLVVADEWIDGQRWNIWMGRFDEDGNTLWMQSLDGAVSGSDRAVALAEDSQGNIYVAGNTEIDGNLGSGWAAKYDAEGAQLWAEPVEEAILEDVALLQDDLILVGGTPQDEALWVGKYDPDFVPLGTMDYKATRDSSDHGYATAIGPDGEVYVAGSSTEGDEASDAVVIGFPPDLSSVAWVHHFGTSSGEVASAAAGIAVNADGSRIAVAGTSSGTHDDALVRVFETNPPPR